MSDREKVKWLQVLLVIWGIAIASLLLLVVGKPTSVASAQLIIEVLVAVVGIATLTYLLVLSWRAAYLSGRGKR